MRTPAPSSHHPYPQVMLLLAGAAVGEVLCPGSYCGQLEQEGKSVGARACSSVMVQFLSLAESLAGTLSQFGWYREEPVSLAVGWGQLVALSADLSPAPRGEHCLSSPLD